MKEVVNFYLTLIKEAKLKDDSIMFFLAEEIEKNVDTLRILMTMLLSELSKTGKNDLRYKAVKKANEVFPGSYDKELADCYQYGYGVEKDIDKAISIYKELVKERYYKAQVSYILGMIYKDINMDEALEWFENGAKTVSYTFSCMCYFELGNYYHSIGNNDKAKGYLEFAVKYLQDVKCKKLLEKITNEQ